jgi:hypothetical protein
LLWISLTALLLLTQVTRLTPPPDVRAILEESGCVLPCALGLHPGITRLDEATAQLQAHPWLSNAIVTQELQRTGSGYVFLEWSGRQPAAINDRLVASVWVEDGAVTLIRLPLTVTLGTLVWPFAPLSAVEFVRLSHTSSLVEATVGRGMVARVTLRCPFRRAAVWSESPELRLGEAGLMAVDGETVWAGVRACA